MFNETRARRARWIHPLVTTMGRTLTGRSRKTREDTMPGMYWKRATTRRELDDAQRVRFRCLVEEIGIAQAGSGAEFRRDISALDALPNVEHVLVYRDDEAIGTARLAFADSDVARATQTSFGFEIERFVDLTT